MTYRLHKSLMAVAICVSAFLLFVVQPIVANVLTPVFGGAASVWIVCILFFQTALLAGYAYAHLLARFLTSRLQAVVHLILVSLAWVALLLNPMEASMRPDAPAVQLLILLIQYIGLPVTMIAATSPLVQYWYGGLSDEPYRLYSVSNIASLVALFSYPVLIEPFLGIKLQVSVWQGGVLLYAVLIGALVFVVRGAPQRESQAAHVTWRERALWFSLSALGAVFLLGVSNALTREILPVPLLWTLPLGIYLLTFVFCFDHDRWYQPRIMNPLLFCAIAGLVLSTESSERIDLLIQVAIYCTLLFAACMTCHGELAKRRPDTGNLTDFYLFLALGGVCGSIFVSLIAPVIFDSYVEIQIAVVALLLFIAYGYRQIPVLAVIALVATIGLGGYFVRHQSNLTATEVASERTFFSQYRLYNNQPGGIESSIRLDSDGITHGSQLLSRKLRILPTTYYGTQSGVGLAFNHFPRSQRKVGVVGLGGGTLAAYGEPGDEIRFYELDPMVETLARTYFSFLGDSPGNVTVALGDGRVSLQRELAAGSEHKFHLIVIDAFNGDAIPFHLLTSEAWDLYWALLREDGVLAVHISNLYLNLVPILRAHNLGNAKTLMVVSNPQVMQFDIYHSVWVLVTSNKGLLESPEVKQRGREITGGEAVLWTDDRHSVLPLLTDVYPD